MKKWLDKVKEKIKSKLGKSDGESDATNEEELYADGVNAEDQIEVQEEIEEASDEQGEDSDENVSEEVVSLNENHSTSSEDSVEETNDEDEEAPIPVQVMKIDKAQKAELDSIPSTADVHLPSNDDLALPDLPSTGTTNPSVQASSQQKEKTSPTGKFPFNPTLNSATENSNETDEETENKIEEDNEGEIDADEGEEVQNSDPLTLKDWRQFPARSKDIALNTFKNFKEKISDNWAKLQGQLKKEKSVPVTPIGEEITLRPWEGDNVKEKLRSTALYLLAHSKRVLRNLAPASSSGGNAKLSWDDFIYKIFHPGERPNYQKAFLLALLISVSHLAGKGLGILFAPKSMNLKQSVSNDFAPIIGQNSNQDDIASIKSTNIFNILQDAQDTAAKKNMANVACTQAQQSSNLPLKVVNTTVLQDSIKSVAAVQIRGSSEELEIREGEKIESMAQVGRIERLKIIFRNLQTGECEYTSSDDSNDSGARGNYSIVGPSAGKKLISEAKPQGLRNEGNNFFIQKKLRDELLKDIGSVLTQARALQINNPDGSLAFKMTEVVPGSIYSHLNIQDNDIITQINGKKIQNINELMNMFAKIKEVDRWQMTVERDGSEQSLEYRFE